MAVNRYWQLLFGRGLVNTPEDFGAQGDFPSHPELLDWLAVEFRESGWDVKRILKEMVMSRTYRQSSKSNPEAYRADPDNQMLSRGSRFRLQGEFIRDTALSLSGLLNDQIGGAGVKPYQPPGLWAEVGLGGNPKFTQDHGDKLTAGAFTRIGSVLLSPSHADIRCSNPGKVHHAKSKNEYTVTSSRHLERHTVH